MSLQPGQSLAHYTIKDKIGQGGMGEVYRATDLRLSRDVAIKVLPAEFAADADRLARFQREAQLLASLSHANIAAIHGLEEAGGVRFLVLELVEGSDLAQRLAAGPLPLPEALSIARQVAAALEEAHERGIVHRDLKPANIKVTPDGQVKVLDFGLAKAMEQPAAGGSSASLSPTITTAATRAGVLLGTAAYMSPEQARGGTVDRRADIWGFGCVLLEMLTGRNTFSESTISDTLASVLRSEPDWKRLPEDAPAGLRRLLRRCLQKDPRQRLRDIGEARIALDDLLSGAPGDDAVPAAPAVESRRGRWALAMAGAVVLAAAATALAVLSLSPGPVPAPLSKFEISPDNLDVDETRAPALSPDGRAMVFVAGGQLWIRSLDTTEPRAIAGTEGASHPFWSPDSRQIGFVRDDGLWKVPVQGGESTVISAGVGAFSGVGRAAWDTGQRIVFGQGSAGLMEVSAAGGEPRTLVEVDTRTESDLHDPLPLPDGKGVLFVSHRLQTMADSLVLYAGGQRREILRIEGQAIRRPVYCASGHIVYRREGTRSGLWALPFSLASLTVTGEPYLIAQDAAFPSTSADGSLLYVRGYASGSQQLVRVRRDGSIDGAIGQPQQRIAAPVVSPDGTRVAVMAMENETWDIWIHEVERGTRTRLTFTPGMDWDPGWTPDGAEVVFWDGDTRAISTKTADGTGVVTRLVAEDHPDSGNPVASADGETVVYWVRPKSPGNEIWARRRSGEGAPIRLLERAENPRLSPDVRYLAYESDESGHKEIYLTRYPECDGRWQVSTAGGRWPIWGPRGDRIYYLEQEVLMEVEVTASPALRLGTPHRLFSAREAGLEVTGFQRFDVTASGEHFIMVQALDREGPGAALVHVQNWASEFKTLD
jgi:serine/threonine-protein kinase